MANHSASIKSIRQIARRNEINSDRRGRVRTFVKKVEEAVQKGDKAAAQAAFRDAQTELSRAAAKGVLKANTVSRKISRLNAKVKGINANVSKSGNKATTKKVPAGKANA